jgi:hypothetical protein
LELWRERYGNAPFGEIPFAPPASVPPASSAVEVQGYEPESNEMRIAQHFRRQEEEERRARGSR